MEEEKEIRTRSAPKNEMTWDTSHTTRSLETLLTLLSWCWESWKNLLGVSQIFRSWNVTFSLIVFILTLRDTYLITWYYERLTDIKGHSEYLKLQVFVIWLFCGKCVAVLLSPCFYSTTIVMSSCRNQQTKNIYVRFSPSGKGGLRLGAKKPLVPT